MLDRQQLNQIRVASPCNESWERMKGDDQVRHCAGCEKDVYNISAMSLDEISKLLARKEGRTCVRFYRRADGTVMTDDCPVGLRKVRRRLAVMAAAVGAVLTAGVAGLTVARGAMARTLRATSLAKIPIVRSLADWMEPAPSCDPVIMGRMMMPPRPTTPPPRVTMGAPAPLPVVKMGKVQMTPPSPAPKCNAPEPTMGEPLMGEVALPAPKK